MGAICLNTYYGFIGQFMAHPGQRDQLVPILLEAADALQDNSDCLLYTISTRGEAPVGIWSTEIWTSKESHDASLKPNLIQAIMQRAMPHIAAIGETTELEVAGGKGLTRLSGTE